MSKSPLVRPPCEATPVPSRPTYLPAGVGFLLLVFDVEMFYLLKDNHSGITQARDKQVEDEQDQSMKDCRHNKLDKDNYQQ